MRKKEDYMEVDLAKLMRALWRKAWAIILAAVIFGSAAFAYTRYLVTPLYKARTLMYVNNSSISVGSTKVNISQGDLTAAQSLVDTYIIILKTRTTLNEVIEQSGVPYTCNQLENMISASSVNSTEIFYIEVTSPDPKEAELLANTIGQVLPDKISSVVDGSSVRIVDYAVEPAHQASPSLTKNVTLGVLLGVILACGVIVIMQLRDDLIHDSDYLLQTYDIPVLAVIPELMASGKDRSGYYGSNPHKGQYLKANEQGGDKRG